MESYYTRCDGVLPWVVEPTVWFPMMLLLMLG